MTNYIKRVVNGVGVILLMTALASFLGYLIRVFLARNLTVADYGLFYAVFTFVTFFTLFKNLGLNQALAKFIPEFLVKKEYFKIKSAIFSVFLINFISAGFLAIIFILLSKSLAVSYFKADSTIILIVLAIYFWVSVIVDICVISLLGFQRMVYYALRPFLLNIFVLLFVIFFTKKIGVLSPVFAYMVSIVIISIIFLILFLRTFSFFKYKLILSMRLIKKLVFFGLPVMLTVIGGTVIGYIDTLLLTYFRTLNEVGVYNVVLPTALLLITLGGSLATVLFPMVSEFWARQMKQELAFGLKIILRYAFVLILPVGLILFTFPKLILRILFGESYVIGSLAMQILVVGTVLYAVAVINTNVISGIGKPKSVTGIILIAALFNIIGNLILIPHYGINGAAFATFLSYFIVLLLSSFKLSKFIDVKIPWFSWLKTFFCGGVFVGVIYFLKKILKFNIWLKVALIILISSIIYFGLCYALRIINLDEIKKLIKNISK